MYNDQLTAAQWALNSAVECHPHTVEVIGSNPIAPTINYLETRPFTVAPMFKMSNRFTVNRRRDLRHWPAGTDL